MYYNSFEVWWWPYVFITFAALIPTSMWRWAGALLVGNINDDSQWIVFVRCLATALVAAVIAQFVFAPNGALAEVPLLVRVVAAFSGFGAFLLMGQRLIWGVVIGEFVLLLGVFFTTL